MVGVIFFLSGMLSSFNTTRPLSSKSMVFLCQYCHSTLSFGICAQYEPNRVWNMDRQKKKNLEEPFPSKKMKKSWSFVHWQRFSPKTIFQCWSMNKLSITGTECCIHVTVAVELTHLYSIKFLVIIGKLHIHRLCVQGKRAPLEATHYPLGIFPPVLENRI